MIWVAFALLTGLAVFAVLWPLSRAPAMDDPRATDVAFYRAQTDEIERDARRGVIGGAEAEAARTEAARRLVTASRHAPAGLGAASPWPPRLAALAALVFVPALTLGLYWQVGAPNLPDDPLEARLNGDPARMDMATIIARIERNVSRDPNDGRGWSLLARLYARLGRTADARDAYRNEIRILGPSEERLSGLGEIEMIEGVVTPEAREHFAQAARLDPRAPRARFYLGLAAEQAGDKTAALATWKQLVADAPGGAPWLPAVQARIAAAGAEPVAPAAVGPGAGDEGRARMAATVAALPPGQQHAAIHSMVDGLASRLKADGGDIDGWLRLVRAYRVLGEDDKARLALADAHRNFAADAGAARRLDALARELGLQR